MFRKRRDPSDFQAEIEAHVELETARLREQGLSEENARNAARRAFGNRTATQEQFHERGRWLWLDSLSQDLRLALRLLAKTPGWTAVAALTAALGIGASVAIFSVVYAVLLRPLPYPDGDRIHVLRERSSYTVNGQPFTRDGEGASVDIYQQLRGATRVFEHASAWNGGTVTWFADDGPRAVPAGLVTSDFFDTFGVQPMQGRTFLPEEDGTQGVAILSYGFWQRAFGGDAAILGRTIRLAVREPRAATVVGIMPPAFDFPRTDGKPADIWVPWPFPTSGGVAAAIVARAVPGATRAALSAEMERISELVRAPLSAKQKASGRRDYYVEPLRDNQARNARRPLYVFTGAVALMLLIVCFNIANLLLARATARQREIGVRLALGAPRRRIVQQLLTESLLIAFGGGALGLGLAWMALGAFNGSQQAVALGMTGVAIDTTVTAFAAALILITGLVFGLAPAWSALGFTVHSALQREAQSVSSAAGPRRARQLLVVGQLGFSLTLLIGAGLLGKCYYQIWATDPGFDPRNLVMVEGARARVKAVDHPRLLQELRAVPGVEAVALTTAAPGTSEIGGMDLAIEGRPDERFHSQVIGVTPEYFGTLGVPLRKGRLFASQDTGVVVVNESFARQFFGSEDPVGRRITDLPIFRNQQPEEAVIAGVVGDFRQHELEDAPPLMVYVPMGGNNYASPVVRARSGAAAIPTVQRILLSFNPNQPPPEVATVAQRFSDSLSPRRFHAVLIGGFAFIATLLAAIGVYGVMSYLVMLRSKEVGIRMALGARPANVLAMIVREGAVLGVIGAVAGLAGAAALTRYMASLLLNVSPYDPATFAALTVLLMAAVLVACYLPGRRAAEADPLVVLRHD